MGISQSIFLSWNTMLWFCLPTAWQKSSYLRPFTFHEWPLELLKVNTAISLGKALLKNEKFFGLFSLDQIFSASHSHCHIYLVSVSYSVYTAMHLFLQRKEIPSPLSFCLWILVLVTLSLPFSAVWSTIIALKALHYALWGGAIEHSAAMEPVRTPMGSWVYKSEALDGTNSAKRPR